MYLSMYILNIPDIKLDQPGLEYIPSHIKIHQRDHERSICIEYRGRSVYIYIINYIYIRIDQYKIVLYVSENVHRSIDA
jgi:hypothetical protein